MYGHNYIAVQTILSPTIVIRTIVLTLRSIYTLAVIFSNIFATSFARYKLLCHSFIYHAHINHQCVDKTNLLCKIYL